MKKFILLLEGIIPFFIGYVINYLVMGPFYNTVLPYKLISITFLIAWFFVGRYSYRFVSNKKVATIMGNSVALIVLLFILYQEVILGQYWTNQVGMATQFYYLPLINLASVFTRMFHTMPATYVTGFLMMCIVYYLGCHTNKHCYPNPVDNCIKWLY